MIKIQMSQLEELEEVVTVDSVVIGNKSRRDYIKEAIQTKHCLIAKYNDSIVGYLTYHTHFFDHSFISLIIVHPEARRKGVALALMQFFETMSPTIKIFSSTNQSNHAMKEVFDKAGYVRSGLIDNLDEDDPEIVYFKERKSENAK